MNRARIKAALIVSTANYEKTHREHIQMLRYNHEQIVEHPIKVSVVSETIYISEEELSMLDIERLLWMDLKDFREIREQTIL